MKTITPPLTLHLDQELSLDPASRFALIITPGAAQRVNLIYEDDGRFMFPGHGKEALHQPGDSKNRFIFIKAS